MKHQKVQLLHLAASGQPRPLVTANVDKMARSIKEVGLIQPIVVKPCAVAVRGLTEQGFQIVAGHHRVAAARSLGWVEIDAIVIEGAGHLDAELIEIDENLCRSELTASQRTKYTARRKQIREAMCPTPKLEVGQVVRPQVSTHGGARPQTQGFAEETAALTGESARNISRRVAIGEALGEQALDRVTGTSLDTGVELAALAKLGTEERTALIDRAQAGETVTARAPVVAAPVVLENAASYFASRIAALLQDMVSKYRCVDQRAAGLVVSFAQDDMTEGDLDSYMEQIHALDSFLQMTESDGRGSDEFQLEAQEKKQGKAGAKKVTPFVLPDWIPVDAWAAFMETRKTKKAKSTDYALSLIVKALEGFAADGHDPVAILDNSIKSGWSDVYAPKPTAAAMTANRRTPSPENFNAASYGPGGKL